MVASGLTLSPLPMLAALAVLVAVTAGGNVRQALDRVLSDERYQIQLPAQSGDGVGIDRDGGGGSGRGSGGSAGFPGGGRESSGGRDGDSASADGDRSSGGRSGRGSGRDDGSSRGGGGGSGGDGVDRGGRDRPRDDGDRPERGSRYRRDTGSTADPASAIGSAGASALGTVATLVGWVLAAVVVILLVVFIVQAVMSYRGDVRAEQLDPPDDADDAFATTSSAGRERLAEWRRLAEAGQYTEALHAMLLYVLARLPKRVTMRFASSSTSREILDRADLAGESHAALSRLVHAVEACYFGGRAADRAAYEHCVEDLHRLLPTASSDAARRA